MLRTIVHVDSRKTPGTDEIQIFVSLYQLVPNSYKIEKISHLY